MSNTGEGTFKSFFGAVAVPILDKGDGTISNVTHDWANAAAALGGGLAITVLRLQIRNRRVDVAKERLAELALANNAQFVFFLDDDVVVPPDALMKMIKLWKSDPQYNIISGVYFSKSDPAMPLIFKGNLEGSYWDWTVQDLIEADGAGAGCLFVNTDVFRKMSKPWFSCDYYYEDPRSYYDIEKWRLADMLTVELMKGDNADPKYVEELEKQMKMVGNSMETALKGGFDPNLMKNKKADKSTTEDLFFFNKAKEELGEKLWIDCSIQCQHQDKRTGRMFGLGPDAPQAKPRYEKEIKPGNKIVIDIGAGTAPYHVKEGFRIKVDNDPKTQPHILADARSIPIEDCYADVVMASHLLEHFSFRESVNLLKEWTRLLKVDGKLIIVVPNLKWASARIMGEEPMHSQEEAERTMFMYYSGQKGTLREANVDIHKSGYTSQSLRGLLERIPGLTDIEVTTSDGNIGNMEEAGHTDDLGYNIIAIAKKEFHDAPMSIKMPLGAQMASRSEIGEKAQPFDVKKGIVSDEKPKKKLKVKKAKKVVKKKVGRPKKKKVGRSKKEKK